MRFARIVLTALVAGCAFATVLSGCRGATISAARLEGTIAVDGRRDDWERIDGYDFEKEDLYLDAAFDDSTLYLMVATSDRTLSMEALRRGLRLRFRPNHDDEAPALWLGSPGSVRAHEMRLEGPPEGRPVPEPGIDRDFGRNTDERLELALADLRDEVRVFTSAGEDSIDLALGDAARLGIEMRPGYEKGGHFILEVKVPLLRDGRHPLAIGAGAITGEAIDLKLFIPKPEGRGEFSGGPPPGMGGRGGPEGGMDGGMGGGMGGGMRGPSRMTHGLDMEVTILLGAATATGS